MKQKQQARHRIKRTTICGKADDVKTLENRLTGKQTENSERNLLCSQSFDACLVKVKE